MIVNHVTLQGVLYITGVERMRMERIGPADTEWRYSGYLVTGSDVEKARHPIRVSSTTTDAEMIDEWRKIHPDPAHGSEAIIEGKLMSVLGGQSYVLAERVRLIGTDALELRRGRLTRDQKTRVGVELTRRTPVGR